MAFLSYSYKTYLWTTVLLCMLVNLALLSMPAVSTIPSPLGLNTTSLTLPECTPTYSECHSPSVLSWSSNNVTMM